MVAAKAPPSVLELEKRWYLVTLPLRQCSLKDIATTTVTKAQMDEYFQEAQAVLDAETAQSQLDRGRWYNAQFLARGTIADKVAAAAVKLADNDFMFFLNGFTLLFDTARADAHHYEAALKALMAVWPKLLPPRPLKRFVAQYFATLPPADDGEESRQARRKVLVYWYLEDHLKRTYAQFLALCETMLKDRVVQRRAAWLEVAGRLMCGIAEGRHVAMAMVLDKLGDPEAAIAHRAYHLLLQLLSESSTHQAMLFTELERIVFTKNCPLRTMRYAANVMNQLVFSKDERKLAVKSVQTYLALFRQLALGGGIDTSVTTAIMVGLRRAFPYSGTDLGSLTEHINALFVLANTGNFQQRVTTLSLLQLLAQGKAAAEGFRNRWYRALYHLLLLSPKQMPQSTQLTSFFAMLHKALRADADEARVAAFVHRLLQRALLCSDAVACAILLLVGELAQARPAVRALLRAAKPASKAAAALGSESAAYDPKAREPQYAHAGGSPVWVLNLLAHHSHPAVVKLAVLLLLGEEIVFDVHPLDDMTPLNFLQMFVDVKAQRKAREEGGTSSSPNNSNNGGGVTVFRRAAHTAHIPSASDPYFVQAPAQEVDVAALFLHRYAVQRQRFLDGLNQVRPTWGDASGESEVAVRVANLDKALFGPGGVLATEEAKEEHSKNNNNTEEKDGEKRRTRKDRKAAAMEVDQDEYVPSEEESEDEGGAKKPRRSSAAADGLDVEGEDEDLEWGSDDEAAYDEENEDMDSDDDEEEEDDEVDGDDDDHALGRAKTQDGAEDDGDDFAALIEHHKKEPSKKRRRETEWLDKRSATPQARGRPRLEMRGRGGRGRGGRGHAARGRR